MRIVAAPNWAITRILLTKQQSGWRLHGRLGRNHKVVLETKTLDYPGILAIKVFVKCKPWNQRPCFRFTYLYHRHLEGVDYLKQVPNPEDFDENHGQCVIVMERTY